MRTCVTARPFRFRLRFGFGLGFRPGFELRLEFRLRGLLGFGFRRGCGREGRAPDGERQAREVERAGCGERRAGLAARLSRAFRRQ